MWTAILGFFQGWPTLLTLIEKFISAYEQRTAALQEERISTAQKDLTNAKTTEEIRKAADEEADAIRHL